MQDQSPTQNGSLEQNSISDHFIFFKKLQAISNKIHATSNVEQIMLELSRDICYQFDCDRLTLYAVSEKKTSIESKVKTGLKSFKDFSLPISEKSIAGYVALSKKCVNILDVYDQAELKTYSPGLQFLDKVDQRTGYRTRQMLAAPIVHAETNELLGVLQLINNRAGGAFSAMMEEGLEELCETLAVAFAQRLKPPMTIQTKYDPLVTEAILSLPELDLAARAARRKGQDIEDVLVEEFQVKLSDIGESLATFFGVYYQPYQEGRVKPETLKNFKRSYVEHNHWLVLEEDADGLVVLSTDPNRIIGSRVIQNFFPKVKVEYCVTTQREFRQTVEQLFDEPAEAMPREDEEEGAMSADDGATDAENALVARVHETIAQAFRLHASDIRVGQRLRTGKTVTRLGLDGSIKHISGQVVINFAVDYPDQAEAAQ